MAAVGGGAICESGSPRIAPTRIRASTKPCRDRSNAKDVELGATKLISSRAFQSLGVNRTNQRPFGRGLSFPPAASIRLIAT